MQTLEVGLGTRSYPIHIGADILDDGRLYAPHIGTAHAAIVTDRVVAPLYLERVHRTLQSLGARVTEVVVESGEEAKRWEVLDGVFDALLAARCDRQTVIVALGGGVVGDLAGFAAAVYQRGVPFIQVPTTLLAQVDSSVGGKTAINHVRGKNMIGAFHQPRAVIADVATLGTLPNREVRAGLAEVLKHGFILDSEFVAWLETSLERILMREPGALVHAIRRSCELKAQVVAADERESGVRALLNFGHTFGHAIETGVGYGQWLHGEAVAAGMVMAAELSARARLIGGPDVQRLRSLVQRAELPVLGPKLPVERYLELMAVDKKAAEGRIRFVVLEAIGRAAVRGNLDDSLVRACITACTGGPDRAR
jgi:3-dehydroquinate synthase